MSNIYVSQFKDVIKNYYSTMKSYDAERTDILSMYTEEFASEKLNILNSKIESEYQKAKELIASIYENVRTLLSVSSFPSASDMNTNIQNIFVNGIGIKLTASEISAFIEQYNNNALALRIIAEYIDNHKEYASLRVKIHTPADKLLVYKKFAESALSLIESIYSNSASNVSMSNIDSYADENFASDMYKVIGSGTNLSSLKERNIPESAKHFFDDISIANQLNNFYEQVK